MKNFIKTSTITRFAPSPTGYLHLGGARTALFNWIFAKKLGGKFLLRIEDTDKSRLNKKALSAIFDGLKWLGINWDDNVIYQSNRNKVYRDVVEQLLKKEKAYRCYSTKDEIYEYKKKLLKLGKTTKFVSPWRENTADSKKNDKYVVRLKVSETGKIIVKDSVQGEITWNCKDLDDLILQRSDGSATYNLAAVVDDHYFNITDIIRGDDHLTNTARQKIIYNALNWNVPRFSHIPLIHGLDGKKMSKRHGAVSVNSYIEEGIKSSALVRYLCQLGLDTGNDDLRTINDIIKDFEIKKIVKSPARFDPVKLNDICGKIIRKTEDIELLKDLIFFLDYNKMPALTEKQQMNLKEALPFLKIRSKNFQELYEQSQFIIIKDVVKISDDYNNLLTEDNIELIKSLSKHLKKIKWIKENINNTIKSFVLNNNIEFKDVAKLIRIAIVGTSNSPGIYDMMVVLGKSEVIRRFTSLGI